MVSTQDVGSRLADKLSGFYDELDGFERFNLQLLMSVAIGGVAPKGSVPTDGMKLEVWKAGIRVLSHINPAGLGYVGRPDFIDANLLDDLIDEANQAAAVSHRTGPQELSPGGAVALELANDPRLQALVSKAVGTPVVPTLVTSYLYYNRPGDHLYPHVDTDVFAINCILMIEHEKPVSSVGSALVVWERSAAKKRVPLKPGEMAILLASGTVHAREPLVKNERLTILTLGFQKA